MTPRAVGGAVLVALAMLGGCSAPLRTDTSSSAAATPAPPATGTPVGAAEMQALYATPHREDGVVVEGAHAGAHWTKWVDPGGTARLSAAHGVFTDTGKFVVQGNEICYTWTQIDGGKPTCLHLTKLGPDRYMTLSSDGSRGSTFQVSREQVSKD